MKIIEEKIKSKIISLLNYTPINIYTFAEIASEQIDCSESTIFDILLELEISEVIHRDYKDDITLLHSEVKS